MKRISSITGLLLVITCILFATEHVEEPKIIYLCGETHYTNEEDGNFKLNIVELAAKRSLVYAIEGLERQVIAEREFSIILEGHFKAQEQAFIYGVEDPLFIIFKEALTINSSLRSFKKQINARFDDLGREVYETKKNDILCPLVNKSNQELLVNFWINENLIGNPVFDYLKKNKRALLKQTFQVQTTTFKPQIKKWTEDDWINFTRELVLILEPIVRKQIPIEKIKTLDFLLTCLEDFELGSNCDAEAKSEFFMKKLHLDLRDDFIIKNLEAIHSIVKDEGKPVVCILGHEHIKGVKKGLEDKGFVVLGKAKFLKTLKSEL